MSVTILSQSQKEAVQGQLDLLLEVLEDILPSIQKTSSVLIDWLEKQTYKPCDP